MYFVFSNLKLVRCILQRRFTQQVSDYLDEAGAPRLVKHVYSGHSHIRNWNSPEFCFITSITDATPLQGGFLDFIQTQCAARRSQRNTGHASLTESEFESHKAQNKLRTKRKLDRNIRGSFIPDSKPEDWKRSPLVRNLYAERKESADSPCMRKVLSSWSVATGLISVRRLTYRPTTRGALLNPRILRMKGNVTYCFERE